MNEQDVRRIIREEFQSNYLSGAPQIAPHIHNGIDNLKIPTSSLTGTIDASIVTNLPASAATNPGGSNGDIQINKSGVFGTISGLNLDQTGNTRGTVHPLDIQSIRSSLTQVSSGKGAIAIGAYITASGNYSVAAGYKNTSSGSYASSFGEQNTASGDYSSAIGQSNNSRGTDDITVGYSNTTKVGGFSSIAMGISNTVTTDSAIAIGVNNTVSGAYAMTIGYNMPSNSTSHSMLIGSYQAGGSLFIDQGGNTTLTNIAVAGVSGGISLYSSSGGTVANTGNINIATSGLHSLPAIGGNVNIVSSNNVIINLNIAIGSHGHMSINTGTDPGAGTGDGVISIQDAITNPSTNPSGGGILYSTGGALHWRGSAGTDTPIAPA